MGIQRLKPTAGGATVKTIQRGTATIGAGTSATATITSVDTAKAELRYLGSQKREGTQTLNDPYIVLTNATTITATRDTAAGNGPIVSYEVTEWQQ